jgi:protein-tyrosine phosphatase
MIDIHHHLLFGVDDGSPDIETSVAMVEAAAQDGITHIVCTPHANSRFPFNPEVNRQKLEMLQERTAGKVSLGLGCDFHLSYDNIEDALQNHSKYTINGKNYLLVEFDDFMIPRTVREVFFEFAVANMAPVITHPERNGIVQRHPDRIKDWLRDGCLVQVTASSLLGRFGRTAQSLAFKFLDNNWVHFIATDAHNTASRPPVMKEACELITKRYGAATAERLCTTNPRAAFYGEHLGPQPDALQLSEYEERAQKGFWSRLFSG